MLDAAGEASPLDVCWEPDELLELMECGFSMWHTALCFSTELSRRLPRAPSPLALADGPG